MFKCKVYPKAKVFFVVDIFCLLLVQATFLRMNKACNGHVNNDTSIVTVYYVPTYFFCVLSVHFFSIFIHYSILSSGKKV